MVYEPREDSYLLAKCVEKRAEGRVIDVGTGSGIQAATATKSEQVTSVEAVDIDPKAVKQAQSKSLQAYESDKFSNIKGKYDTIICNAPYLPDEPQAPDIALDGGAKGFEWTNDFLKQAKKHLADKGQILLLISTLTNKDVVETEMLERAYQWEIIAKEKHSFEELLVYRIRHALPQHPEATYLAKGKRSRVYRVGDAAIKIASPRRITQEAQMLEKVNALGIGPKLLKTEKNKLWMQYIQGQPIGKAKDEITQEKLKKVLEQVGKQMKTLDQAGINKLEMTNPHKHIILNPQGPVLIDWERARYSQRPKNVNQFEEYKKKLAKEGRI